MYRSMKILTVFLLSFFLLGLSFACGSEELESGRSDVLRNQPDFSQAQYEIDGLSFIVTSDKVVCHFDRQNDESDPSQEEGMITTPTFPSMQEMVYEFLSGNLNPEVVTYIRSWPKSYQQSDFAVLKKEKLFEPTVPEDVDVGSEVVWVSAENYSVPFRVKNGSHGWVSFGEDYFNTYFKKNYADYIGSHTVTQTYERKLEERNAMETGYVSRTGVSGYLVQYQFEANGKQFFVTENYWYLTENERTAMTHLFVIDGDARLYVQFFDLPERPSVDWFASFGARLFTDYETKTP